MAELTVLLGKDNTFVNTIGLRFDSAQDYAYIMEPEHYPEHFTVRLEYAFPVYDMLIVWVTQFYQTNFAPEERIKKVLANLARTLFDRVFELQKMLEESRR